MAVFTSFDDVQKWADKHGGVAGVRQGIVNGQLGGANVKVAEGWLWSQIDKREAANAEAFAKQAAAAAKAVRISVIALGVSLIAALISLAGLVLQKGT